MPKSQPNQQTRDFLIRNLPVELADKLKVAATLHRMSMKDYIQSILEAHLENCANCGPYFDQYLQTVDWVREDGSFQIDPPEELVEMTLHFLREHYDDL